MISRRRFRQTVEIVRYEIARSGAKKTRTEMRRRKYKAEVRGITIDERLTAGKLFGNATLQVRLYEGRPAPSGLPRVGVVPEIDASKDEAIVDGRPYVITTAPAVETLGRTRTVLLFLSARP